MEEEMETVLIIVGSLIGLAVMMGLMIFFAIVFWLTVFDLVKPFVVKDYGSEKEKPKT